MKDPIHKLVEHALSGAAEDAQTIESTQTFVLDSLGVTIAGRTGPGAEQLLRTVRPGRCARALGTDRRFAVADAAFLNTYQMHCQEFDCVHDRAVVHVMTAVLSATLAYCERAPVTGRQLIDAIVVGVDIAATLGLAARGGLKFFRPGIAGAFGAAGALGRLMGFNSQQMVQAFSLTYGQLCGTMQAHHEGSGLLAMQLGFNARNAVLACELAQAGFTGPQEILTGKFGYFSLFEDGADTEVLNQIGRVAHINQVSHKPFPSGRATHGVLDGILSLQAQHGFGAKDIARIDLHVTPLGPVEIEDSQIR